ncbi:purine nucleosidase [Scopulibacillus darangshiensis]|uniref:Purine nucleosidase n=1 Tax=Scopulibacillus darangshiensis TaxID=442528 RepID=A0A4R2NEK5_9BACL|nr:nucleoside hydrolase [Scopulibacillus darangshiensis]TCP19535.1 purine nucleosidase [Scopulibacillus darangshiensis]
MKNIILDVDTGIDDALAISYAVQSPELNILGITTSFGNTSVPEATRNTLQVLEVLGARDIPVIPGVEEKFNGDVHRDKTVWIHGQNGIGDAVLPEAAGKPLDMLAHDFIISAVRDHPHDVTILTVASQVNLAMAIQKDPGIVPLIDDVIVMGGAVTVPGNVTPFAEANIHTDADAAQFTFQSGLPVTLVGLDVTKKTLLKRDVLQTWRKEGTDLARILADACDFYMNAYAKNEPDLNGCALHDPLTVGAAIDPSFVKTVPMTIDVVTEGEKVGQTIGEKGANERPIQVCLEVDSDRFVSHFLERVTGHEAL